MAVCVATTPALVTAAAVAALICCCWVELALLFDNPSSAASEVSQNGPGQASLSLSGSVGSICPTGRTLRAWACSMSNITEPAPRTVPSISAARRTWSGRAEAKRITCMTTPRSQMGPSTSQQFCRSGAVGLVHDGHNAPNQAGRKMESMNCCIKVTAGERGYSQRRPFAGCAQAFQWLAF